MKKNRKKIAVIGAGFFGCTIALILSKRFKVDLYEKESDILNGASLCNQFRFHLGYHYPRSLKTVNEIKKSNKDFIKFYGNDVFGKTKNYYGIVKNKSNTGYKKYINFLKKNNLPFKLINNSNFISSKIEGTLISKEKILNYFKIKKKIKKKIKLSRINLILNSVFKKKNLNNYHKVIITSYQNNNNVLSSLKQKITKKFRYELVEKIVIKLPKKYKKVSFVVLDGKFVCMDPYLGTNYHLLSHVKHSKLEIIKSKFPNFKKKHLKFLKQVKSSDIKISKFDKFIKYGAEYLPFLNYSKYMFSYFVVRALKCNVESTDERTNFKSKINKKIITVLAGKWNTCVYEAKKIDNSLR